MRADGGLGHDIRSPWLEAAPDGVSTKTLAVWVTLFMTEAGLETPFCMPRIISFSIKKTHKEKRDPKSSPHFLCCANLVNHALIKNNDKPLFSPRSHWHKNSHVSCRFRSLIPKLHAPLNSQAAFLHLAPTYPFLSEHSEYQMPGSGYGQRNVLSIEHDSCNAALVPNLEDDFALLYCACISWHWIRIHGVWRGRNRPYIPAFPLWSRLRVDILYADFW